MRVESSGKAFILTEKDGLTEKSPPPTPTHTQQEDTEEGSSLRLRRALTSNRPYQASNLLKGEK